MHNKSKQKVGASLMCGLSVVLGHMGATQWFARKIRYEDAFLGDPLLIDKGMGVKLYAPHRIYTWMSQYRGEGVDDVLTQSMGFVLVGTLLGFVLGALIWRARREPGFLTAHGSARWATEEEIQARGLMRSPVARLNDEEWVAEITKKGGVPERATSSICFAKHHDGQHYFSWDVTHILAFAPTRSGKGVGMVIPTLLTWTESVVVTDIKGENFQITGWWRSLFSHVIYLNPTDPNSACYNPLLEVRKGIHAIKDAMNLSTILGARPQGKESPFWDGFGKDVMTSTLLYVLYTQKTQSLGQCIKLLMNSTELFERMQECELKDKDVQALLNDSASSFLEQDEKMRGGWVATAMGYLSLWKDPIVARNTATSDFRLRDIQFAKNPMSVFLVVPPGDIERLSPLIRMFFEQLTDALTLKQEVDEGEHRHRLLMMLDEFPQFGQMKKVEKAISYTASYDIKWFFITQGLAQIDQIYGPNNGILANCHLRMAYRCNDNANSERLSDELGETTGTKEQEGESGKKGILSIMSNKSVSKVEFKRQLVTPGELQTMEDGRVIVMESGRHPIKAHKLTYYDDPFFIPRYDNKGWAFPTVPMTDFPHAQATHDWMHVSPSKPRPSPDELALNSSTKTLRQDAIPGGEEPISHAVLKITRDEVEHLDIPVEMTSHEATMHVTTSSMRREHLQDMLERGVRAGLVNQDILDFMQRLTPPSSDEPTQAHELPDESMEPVFDPHQPFDLEDDPQDTAPPHGEAHADGLEMVPDLNAFIDQFDGAHDLDSSEDEDMTPGATCVVEGLAERMEEMRRTLEDKDD